MLGLLFLFFSQAALATDLELGTFSLATEAGWTAWFELKPSGEALVSEAYDTEDFDPAVAAVPKPTPKKGKWKKTNEGIEINYGNVTDHLKLEQRCKEWQIHPCFRFVRSTAMKEKSLLNYKQAYVNWNWKIDPPKALPKAEFDKCKKECEQMAARKQLKKDMTAASCVEVICKPSPPQKGFY